MEHGRQGEDPGQPGVRGPAFAAAIRQAQSKPRVFVQGSAIGYYGPRGDEELTEASPPGSDFLARVCRETEEATEPLEGMGVRRAVVRTGIVLAPHEGALKIMTPLFKFGPGAPIGSDGRLGPAQGQQWMSWIHIDDIVGIFKLALENAGRPGTAQRHGAQSRPQRRVRQDLLGGAPQAADALAFLPPLRAARCAAQRSSSARSPL